MKKLEITHVSNGLLNETGQVNYFKGWNNCQIELTDNRIKLMKDSLLVHDSPLDKIEEDNICITYKATLKNGLDFRVITSGSLSFLMQGDKEFSIGSMNPQGFAVYFRLSEAHVTNSASYTTSSREDSLDKAASRIMLYIQNGMYNEAKSLADDIINHNAEPSVIHYLRGISHNFLNQWLKARNDFNAIIDYLPQELQPECYSNRAIPNLNLENYEGAIFDCNQTLKINPNSDDAYVSRGWAYMSIGKMDNAVDDFLKALEINPKNSYALENLETIVKMHS